MSYPPHQGPAPQPQWAPPAQPGPSAPGWSQPQWNPGLPAPRGAGAPPGPPGPNSPAVLRLKITQPMSLGISLIPLNVQLNGYPQTVSMGDNTLLLPPGHHQLNAWVTWIFGRYGQVTRDLYAEPGQQIDLTWAIPYTAWTKQGALGPGPQKSPGLRGLIIYLVVVLGVVIGLPLLFIIIAALAN